MKSNGISDTGFDTVFEKNDEKKKVKDDTCQRVNSLILRALRHYMVQDETPGSVCLRSSGLARHSVRCMLC